MIPISAVTTCFALNVVTDIVPECLQVIAEIIKDERTLNKKIIAYGEVLSQSEINTVVETKTGEKLELNHVRATCTLYSELKVC
jgi:hypothetical protein